jgi:hypothetical protein
MALPVVRAFPIFLKNKKLGQAHGTNFTIMPNRTKLFGAEGFLALSRGAVTTGVDVDFIMPVSGIDVDVLAQMILQQDVGVQLPIGGKMYVIEMGYTNGNVQSSTENGVVNGKFTLEGGVPQIT